MLTALVLTLALAPPPQEAYARRVAARAETLERGGETWFAAGFERIEAELRHDVSAAHASALALLEAARAGGDPGLAATAAVFANLTLSTLEGPSASGEWNELAGAPPAGAPAWLRARNALARSRQLCQLSSPGDELAIALEGAKAAREAQDPALRALSALITWHVTHDSAETFYEDLRAELSELAANPDLVAFRHRILHLQLDDSYAEHTREERLASLAEIEELAATQGDRAALGRVAWARADLAMAAGDTDEALRQLELAAATFERQGDVRDRAFSLEMACDMALARDRLAEAEAFLARAEELVAGRGFEEREAGLMRSRFGLAVARKDSAEILELSDALEEIEKREEEELRAYEPLRDKLLSAERERVEAERALAAERARQDAARVVLRRAVLAGALFVLLLLTVMALRSRSQLLRANRRLAGEMQRAERESEARLALEERMRQLERADSLGLVAGGVAHDFNNLMVGVLGNAELLLMREHDPRRRELLEAIAASGQRAARLCKQLLACAGDRPEPKTPLELAPLVRELEPVLRTAAGSGIELVLRIEAVPAFDGDRTMLEQAVLNLVTNARDAHARRIELVVGALELDSAALEQGHFRGDAGPGRFVTIEVRDDGEGMPEEVLARIFDPFFTTRFPGRGLGLAVVFGAVRRHGGLVEVASRPGSGARFRLCLPLAAEPVKVLAPQAPAQAVAALTRLDVLAIDDEAQVRTFLRAALEQQGHRIRTLADGHDFARALDDFEVGAQAVLLLDLTLPGEDGRDLARAACARRPGLTLVLMSGHAGAHIAELARELGASGWLQKPFTLPELEGTLARAVEGGARSASSAAQAGK
jgi:signal transduction histidine kinase/ActR/RegA family two-component response regulator